MDFSPFVWALPIAAIGIGIVLISGYLDLAARISRIERKQNLLLRHQGIDLLQGLPLSDRVKEMADDPARKIQAIKLYRDETGAGLKEAKEAVETYMNSK